MFLFKTDLQGNLFVDYIYMHIYFGRFSQPLFLLISLLLTVPLWFQWSTLPLCSIFPHFLPLELLPYWPLPMFTPAQAHRFSNEKLRSTYEEEQTVLVSLSMGYLT